jgi:hypothetical protein
VEQRKRGVLTQQQLDAVEQAVPGGCQPAAAAAEAAAAAAAEAAAEAAATTVDVWCLTYNSHTMGKHQTGTNSESTSSA